MVRQQAADVTSLGSVFQGKTLAHGFNELEHFTGIPSTMSATFKNATITGPVKVPAQVRIIRGGFMENCKGSNIALDLSPVARVEDMMGNFSGSSVRSIVFGENLDYLVRRSFYQCKNLEWVRFTKMTGPTLQNASETFYDCWNANLDRRIYIPQGATGYDALMSSAAACSFSTVYYAK